MNPAHDLLNYIDEHKTEMKDDTYKNIVEKISKINGKLQKKTCTCKFIIFYPHFYTVGENQCVNILSKTKEWTFDLDDYQYKRVKDQLVKHGGQFHATLCHIEVIQAYAFGLRDDIHIDYVEDIPIEKSNTVLLVDIVMEEPDESEIDE